MSQSLFGLGASRRWFWASVVICGFAVPWSAAVANPPLPPIVGGIEGETTDCTDPQVETRPVCQEWRQQIEAYEARAQRPAASQAPAVSQVPAQQLVIGNGPPLPPIISTGGDFEDFSCDDAEVSYRTVCQQWRRQVDAYWAQVEALRQRLADRERLKGQAEAKRKAAVERARRQADAERQAAQARARQQAEAERQAAVERARQAAEAEAARRATEERREVEALRERLDVEERLRHEAEAKSTAAEERARRATEEHERQQAKAKRQAEKKAAKAKRAAETKAAEAKRKTEQAAQAQRRAQLTAGLTPVNRFNEVVMGDATVRELPEAGAKAVRKLQLGEQVHVVGELPTGWVQVAREGIPVGWLHGSALRQPIAMAPAQRTEPAAAAVAAAPPLPATPRPSNRPNLGGRNYALIIGNNDYANLPNLKTAVGDAAAVAEMLKLRYTFEPRDVKLLLNAGRREILDELASLRGRLGSDDRLLIYYAGHGVIDAATNEGFWQPVDAEVGRNYTWIANYEVRLQLRGLPAKHVLVVADSCFSGTLTRSAPDYSNIPKDRFFTEIDSYVSRKAISSGGTEPVADVGTAGHSVFAFYFLKMLRNNRRPFMTSFELFNKLVRAVTNNSKQKPTYGTVADAGDEGSGDFTLVLR